MPKTITLVQKFIIYYGPVIKIPSYENEDAIFYDTIDEMCISESQCSKVDIVLKYILKQKYLIISERHEK